MIVASFWRKLTYSQRPQFLLCGLRYPHPQYRLSCPHPSSFHRNNIFRWNSPNNRHPFPRVRYSSSQSSARYPSQEHPGLTIGTSPVIIAIPFLRGIVSPDEFSGVRYNCFRPLKNESMLAVHEGAIWDIAASQGAPGSGVHGLVLSAGSDGVCDVISATNRLFGRAKVYP